MTKAPDAFRTISEVSEWLDTPTYVLRFWESRFSQIKPVKRAGGRRYYRPEDMLLLGGIKKLLHFDGHTIKGLQNLIKERGIKYISGFSPGLDEQVVSPASKDDSVKVDIDSLIKVSRAKERSKAQPDTLQLNKDDKENTVTAKTKKAAPAIDRKEQEVKKPTAKQVALAEASTKQKIKAPTAKETAVTLDSKKQGAKAVKITVHKKAKDKVAPVVSRPIAAKSPIPESKPVQKIIMDIPEGKLASGPFKVGPASSYTDDNFQEIETLYYSLKMVRNTMKRAHAAR